MKFGKIPAMACLLIIAFASTTFAQFNVFGTVNGRIEQLSGRGVGRTAVMITNLTTLESQSCVTNDFGYFRFGNLPILDLYVVTVRPKRHSFNATSQVVQFSALDHYTLFVAND